MIDTENPARHFDTKILITLTHKKMSQIKNSNTTNILHKTQLRTIKQIRRKLIKKNNKNEIR